MSVKHTPGPVRLWADPSDSKASSFGEGRCFVTLDFEVASHSVQYVRADIADEMLDALEKIEQQLDYGQIDTARRIAASALLRYILHRQSQGRAMIEQKG